MSKHKWYLVIYPSGVWQVEWLTEAEADVIARATGRPVKQVSVGMTGSDWIEVKGAEG
jgi:hypothetical protein